MNDRDALQRRLLALPGLTPEALDTLVTLLDARDREARLREDYLRERLEDAYSGALGAHTGSGPDGLPPILGAAELRSILDKDLSDPDALQGDMSPDLSPLPPKEVHRLVIAVLTSHRWGRRGDTEPGDAHFEHAYDRRCGVCRGDGQQIGTAVAFAYADLAEALEPLAADLPRGPSLSRLVSLVAEVVLRHQWTPDSARHSPHPLGDARCMPCVLDAPAIAECVTAAYVALTLEGRL